MSSLKVADLGDEHPFGARVANLSRAALDDEAVKSELRELFERRGLIVFEEVEATGQMQVAISNVFGPLKDHPVRTVSRVDQETMPGVIDLRHDPDHDTGIVEVNGKALANWLPWHFDHCYNNELNRAAVLRAITVAPEGGMTGFADGIQLYQALSPDLRREIEHCKVLYTLDLAYSKMRYGKPPTFREIRVHPGHAQMTEYAKTLPRAVHPAVWTRSSGEKVLHVSPWMAVGLEGRADPQGEQLLAAVSREIIAKARPYLHHWHVSDMLVWDNWRLLHSVSGCDPRYPRRMHRTTIKGDYGLGYFENGRQGDAILEMTV